MRIGDLTPAEIVERLRAPGLGLRCGPFSVRVYSPLATLAHAMRLLYADYSTCNAPFADFHVGLSWAPRNVAFWRRQAQFCWDGKRIFDPFSPESAAAYFEWGLNYCIFSQAHQYLIIHAAAVERGGRALLLPGTSGSGKSTLCAALVAKGWRLLTDELVLLNLSDGRVTPLPRPISLKNESLALIHNFGPRLVFGPVAHGTEKGTVGHVRPPEESVEHMDHCAVPAWIVLPRFQAGERAQWSRMTKATACLAVIANAFNYGVLGLRGFRALAGLIDRCSCWELVSGRLQESVDALEDLTAGEPSTKSALHAVAYG